MLEEARRENETLRRDAETLARESRILAQAVRVEMDRRQNAELRLVRVAARK